MESSQATPALIDIGANLTHESFQDDLSDVLTRARERGVAELIVTGASIEESAAARDISAQQWGLYSTAGLHPHLATRWGDASEQALRDLATAPTVVALGETGLDFNRDFSPRAAQEDVFQRQLELAVELQMPVFMHERDAHDRFAAILSRYRDHLTSAVVHCFTGTAAQLDAYLEMDVHIGITGWICDERRGTHLRDAVRKIPLDRLMIETDSPYLLPRDLKPKPKHRRNEPMHLLHIAGVIADCMQISVQELAAATSDNARRFFNLHAASQMHPQLRS